MGADSSLHQEGLGTGMAHEKWTEPWSVVSRPISGISREVKARAAVSGRTLVSAAHVKTFYARSIDLRYTFEDEPRK